MAAYAAAAAMRDLDMVVGLAYVVGVDPAVSQSTIEVRTDLLRETCKLLKMENVKFDSRHAPIAARERSSIHGRQNVLKKRHRREE